MGSASQCKQCCCTFVPACVSSIGCAAHVVRLGVERKICGLDLVYTLFVGSFYTVDLSQSHFGSFVYAHASDWFFSLDLMLAPPVLDLSCIRTLDLHLACFLHLLCWILFVFVHWICFY